MEVARVIENAPTILNNNLKLDVNITVKMGKRQDNDGTMETSLVIAT